MKNIIQIFKNDLLRIHKNVIAMIVIMGITVIPTLYAWFNIAASWDPYGNTGNLKVAVASNDEGYKGELLPVNLNLGDDVISELQMQKMRKKGYSPVSTTLPLSSLKISVKI